MDGSPIEQLAADRRRILAALKAKTGELQVAVREALAAGVSEVSAAQRAGVTRMTVRAWAGKPPQRRKRVE
jgi:hypothetical protein